MGRSTDSAFTLPRCHRLSSSTRCLIATCAPTCRCCILQPPQAPSCNPKCGQCGRTRWDDSLWISVRLACSQLFFLRLTLADTSSDGSAPSMNTTLPSALRATPCASMSSASTCSHPSGKGALFSISTVIPRLSQVHTFCPDTREKKMEIRICIDVDDLERGIAFYAQGLGLRTGRRLGNDWVELLGAGSPIDLL